jgi:transposase-like protein
VPNQKKQIVELARRRRWSEADARMMVRAWSESGDSQAGFARDYGLDVQRLGHWVRRLASEPRDAESAVRFHAVRVVGRADLAQTRESTGIEIVLGDGRSVRVARGVDAKTLRVVLRVVGERC